jgi:hypothetical protein
MCESRLERANGLKYNIKHGKFLTIDIDVSKGKNLHRLKELIKNNPYIDSLVIRGSQAPTHNLKFPMLKVNNFTLLDYTGGYKKDFFDDIEYNILELKNCCINDEFNILISKKYLTLDNVIFNLSKLIDIDRLNIYISKDESFKNILDNFGTIKRLELIFNKNSDINTIEDNILFKHNISSLSIINNGRWNNVKYIFTGIFFLGLKTLKIRCLVEKSKDFEERSKKVLDMWKSNFLYPTLSIFDIQDEYMNIWDYNKGKIFFSTLLDFGVL